MLKKIVCYVLPLVFLSSFVDAVAEEDNNPLIEIIVASKATGMCGAIQQMVSFQESTKMTGGDEFIARFVSTEAARLGKTVPEFVAQCEAAISIYTETMNTLQGPD